MSSTTGPSVESGVTSTPAEVVNRYLDAFYTGDYSGAGSVLVDDFSFSGPFVEVTGRDAFLASAERLRPILRGHSVVRQWIDGSDVATIYDVRIETPASSGVVRMSEWHSVIDGRLTAGQVFFDSERLRALLPTPSA